MDVEDLIGTMLQGTLTGRRKYSHRSYGYLAGGGNSFLNASTLLTVGGLIWGAIETMQQQSARSASPAPAPGPYPAGPAARQAGSAMGLPPGPAVPAPVPSPQTYAPSPVATPPPLPSSGAASTPVAGGEASGSAIPEGALRIIRLMISAARADGTMTPEEKNSIMEAARNAGAEAEVVRELSQPTPLASIVEGLSDRQQCEDLYILAFGIVRGDEQVTGAERIYLAQLAALLKIDQARSHELEAETAARIDAQPGA